METHIQLTDVSKIFTLGFGKRKTAVENLSLTVPAGKVIGLLGPNGSGKSTTIKMIMGFLKPTSGEILVCGHSPSDPNGRRPIGYLPENPRFQRFLRGGEALAYYGKLVGLAGRDLSKRIDELLSLVGLSHAGRERIQGYSKGMTQRLAIAQSLLTQPRLLIFDEPMSGLDPLGRMEIRKLISSVHSELPESTIFFSSHILDDVEQLCSYVALLRGGKLKTFSRIEELILPENQRFDLTVRGLTEARTGARTSPIGTTYLVNGMDALRRELDYLTSVGAQVINISSHKRGLEEALFRDNERNAA